MYGIHAYKIQWLLNFLCTRCHQLTWEKKFVSKAKKESFEAKHRYLLVAGGEPPSYGSKGTQGNQMLLHNYHRVWDVGRCLHS